MAITVRQLVSRLKKMPQNALVCWQNHDQNEDETDGFVNNVSEGTPSLHTAHADMLEYSGKKKIVVLGT